MKRFRIDNPFLLKDESGNVIIIVAILMVVLLGMTAFAVDVGDLYQNRRDMVNAADAAAMAGVQQFLEMDDESDIEGFAESFAMNNYNCHNSLVKAEADNSDYSVKIKVGRPVEYTFGKVLGLTSTDVTAEAKAVIRAVEEMEGLIPIHMQQGFFNTIISDPDNLDSEHSLVHFHQISHEPGNWGWVYFDKNENKFKTKEYLEYGYPYPLPIGYGSENKSFVSNTGFNVKDVEDILEKHKTNETVLYIPISKDTNIIGNTELEIVGFAPIHITSYVIAGPQDFNISGKILKDKLADQAPGSSFGSDFDIRTIVLVE